MVFMMVTCTHKESQLWETHAGNLLVLKGKWGEWTLIVNLVFMLRV